MSKLMIGTRVADGEPMYLPEDLTDKKIAMLAQSKKGKTYGLGVILEEMGAAGQPFIATDPADNLWGLRVMPDGTPSGFQVVIFGGSHADLPFEKDKGERVAEMLIETPMNAILDVTQELPNTVRVFMTAFAQRLMRSKPEGGRVLFLEEAPELIPQKPMGIQARMCADAVAKIAVIGGNFGYGVVAASQRAATIDKNVLSQCEALIVMGMTHEKDRMTVKGWIDSKDHDERAMEAFNTLGSLEPGEAWLWWPNEDRFERFRFRRRKTLHPREMRKLGLKPSSVQLGDMKMFVERARRELTKTVAVVCAPAAKNPRARRVSPAAGLAAVKIPDAVAAVNDREISELKAKVVDLEQQLSTERRLKIDLVKILRGVRDYMRPQYEVLRALYEDTKTVTDNGASSVDRQKYEIWFKNAPREGMRKMLEYLLEKRSATIPQLGTIAGVSPRSTSNYVAWLKRNKIASMQGGKLVLLEI